MHECDAPRLCSATNQRVEIVGILSFYVRMDEARVRVELGELRNLAVPILLGTSFVDKFVKGVFPSKRKIVTYNSPRVSLLLIHEALTDNQGFNDESENGTYKGILVVEYVEREQSIRIARTIVLQPMSETAVLVVTNAKRLVEIESLPALLEKCPCTVARGLLGALPRHPFRVLAISTSNKDDTLVKLQRVAVAVPPPVEIVHSKSDESSPHQKGGRKKKKKSEREK